MTFVSHIDGERVYSVFVVCDGRATWLVLRLSDETVLQAQTVGKG